MLARADVPDMVEVLEGSLGFFTRGPPTDVGLLDLIDAIRAGGLDRRLVASRLNNVVNTLNLLDAMIDNGVLDIVFSSTCATYSEPNEVPISESHPQHPVNPYGESKLAGDLEHPRVSSGEETATVRSQCHTDCLINCQSVLNR
jgi:hypothetical protein